MRLLHTIRETQEAIGAARAECRSIGLVPTMGALHEGHMALVGEARASSGFVVVSVFVNPTQFGPSEDFARYPRTLAEDAERCREAGADLVFAPAAGEMYPPGFDSWVDVRGLTEVFEGAARPGHFRGVTTVCAKLFNITGADIAIFGAKDYQQLQVLRKMVRDLEMRVRIVAVETVREPDGLAMSSRNRYLSPEERQAALVLSRSLRQVGEAFEAGARDPRALQALVEDAIRAEPRAQIDYAAVVDAETLEPVDSASRPMVVLLAARIGDTRLIDNTILL